MESSTSSTSTHTSSATTSSTTNKPEGSENGNADHENSQNEQGTCGQHGDTGIPFWINGTKLMPTVRNDSQEGRDSGILVKPGQTVTLTFTGIILVQPESDEHGQGQTGSIATVPISGNVYAIQLMGEGQATIQVTAS
jgi:hypothetical protein